MFQTNFFSEQLERYNFKMIELLWTVIGTVLSIITYLAYMEYNEHKQYKDQGLHYFGNKVYRLLYTTIKGISMPENLINQYETLKNKKLKFGVGADFRTPLYFISDLDLVKQILVKDFDYFVDRRSFSTTKNDHILGKMLISVKGDQWKSLRSTMSQIFTPSKMKRMFKIFDLVSRKLVKFIEREISKTSDKSIDLRNAISKTTMDYIASAVFAIDSKAFDQTEQSEFEKIGGKSQFSFDLKSIIKLILWLISPKILETLGLSIMNPDAQEFFTKLITTKISQRQKSKEKCDDFLQLMLEARAGKLRSDDSSELGDFEKEAMIRSNGNNHAISPMFLEDEDIIAQCVLFIFGGYDTMQSLYLFALYNLATYPEIQEKLYREIKTVFDQNNGKLSYDSVNNKMQYLDMFIQETLRYYPPAIMLERTCTKDFKILDSNVTIKKGNIVLIPTYAIQRDEKYFENPHTFDPERFSPQNKSKLQNSCAFSPFGHGPRNCLGMRFALIEVKVTLAHLLHNFMLQTTEKTPIPLKFAKRADGGLSPDGEMWLKLIPRQTN